MNYLKGKKCYLSGPIHSATDDGVQWRDYITPKLNDMGIEALDPCKVMVNGDISISEVGKNKQIFRDLIKTENWQKVKEDFWPIVRKDLRMVDHSDFVIFYYDTEAKMTGSIHELVVAVNEKKVILIKYNKETLNDFNPWVATFAKAHHLFAEWDNLFDHLKKVDDGIFDTSLWVI